jgi:hypothetical protein
VAKNKAAQELGRLGGLKTSDAKTKASGESLKRARARLAQLRKEK